MRVTVFAGDIADAPAEVVCTSTNPRLSLMMGSGGSIRDRGGFEVLRACEEIVARNGGPLRAGSVHVTTAGRLPFKAAIHCVASDATHLSSANVIQACVRNALAAAGHLGARSVAMPVFATGHARLKFPVALQAMAEALRSAETSVEEAVIVVFEPDRVADAKKLLVER